MALIILCNIRYIKGAVYPNLATTFYKTLLFKTSVAVSFDVQITFHFEVNEWHS